MAPDLPAPPGYSHSVAVAATEATRETDSSLLIKRSWDIALQPLKSVRFIKNPSYITILLKNTVHTFELK